MAGSPSPAANAIGAAKPTVAPLKAEKNPLRRKPRRVSSSPLALMSVINSWDMKCSGALTSRALLAGFSTAETS